MFMEDRVYGGPMVSGDVSPNSRGGAPPPDPAQIETLPALAAGLNALRHGRSYAELDQAVGGQAKAPVLPPSTLSDMVNGKSLPSRDTMVRFLAACGLAGAQQQPWLAAWERVDTGHLRRPAGAVRVREAQPRVLGVHASIQVDPRAHDLPVYVPRDLDADLRAAVSAAAEQGGFVLLRGGSSVGKTRALYEAVHAALPEWWLLQPTDAGAVPALADGPPRHTVLWLDELQHYLNHGGLPVGVIRALITEGVVVVGTLWPDEYGTRTAPRTPGQPDPHANDRELLGLAHVIDVPERFSDAERSRARCLDADQRIRAALDAADAGLTQVLAAGPQLIRWWEHADTADPRQCYGKAVITAALDARRLGAQAPLTPAFLTAAAPAYLTSAQQAAAPPDWFEQAVAYASTLLCGAAACLTPVAAAMGQVAGYLTADYLHQHAQRLRRDEPVPDVVWQGLVEHHRGDTLQLAESAERRDRPRYAELLYRRLADAGDWPAAYRLAALLARQGRYDELRQRADAGDGPAAYRLAELLAEQGRVDEAIAVLRRRADAGDRSTTNRLADLLADQGRVDELRERADAGDGYAANRLVDLLARQGCVDELRRRADAGDGYAVVRLAVLLAEQRRFDRLRECAAAGDRFAAYMLADLLAEQDRVDELRQRADAGDGHAANRLADLLAGPDRIEELEREVLAGSPGAERRLTILRRRESRRLSGDRVQGG